MNRMNAAALLSLLMVVSTTSWSNGGPVAWTDSKPSGGIEPRQENCIELLSEKLNISILDLNSYKVDANYRLRNPDGDKRITYGVPLYWVGEFNPVDAASGVHISVNKKDYRCHATEPVKHTSREWLDKLEMYGGVGEAWCIAEIDVPRGEAIQLNLRYTADLEFEDWEFSKSALTEFSNRKLLYPVAPAGYWKGTPDLHVELNLGPYKYSVLKQSPDGGAMTPGVLTWDIANADLKTIDTLSVEFDSLPLLQHEQFVTWNATEYKAKLASWTVEASSTLEPAGGRYVASNMMDGDPSTAWCEGNKGSGVSESFTAQLVESSDGTPNYCHPEGIVIVPGYAKSEKVYLDNGRINKVRVEDCQDPSSYVELDLKPDEHFNRSARFVNTYYSTFIPRDGIIARGGQWVEKDTMHESYVAPSCLRFIIKETTPGRRYDDTCISEIAFVRNCG